MNTRVNRAPWPMHTRGCIETTLGWIQERGRGERGERSGRENDGTRDGVRGGLVGSWRMSRLRNYLMNARGAYECSRCLTRGRMRGELLGPLEEEYPRTARIHVPIHEYVRSRSYPRYEKKSPLNWRHYAITPLRVPAVPRADI